LKKIYLSAPGLVCCAGQNRDELYKACLTGDQSGITMRQFPDGSKFPTGQILREMPAVHKTKIIRIIDAALEQIRSDIETAVSKYGTEKIGVCLGSCDNGSENLNSALCEFLANGEFPAGYNLSLQRASSPAEYIAAKFGITGPVMTVSTACASGASAIIKGAELIKEGVCDAVIAGGADIVFETVLFGFHSLEALSNELTNPFSKNRKGINLGEGAAFFLLDSQYSAQYSAQNFGIELLGYGESADAFHMTAPGENGDGPAKAMTEALAKANIKPEMIGYVNLHGTGTPLNDKAEALSMKTVFGGNIPPANSTKPITGHTLGAAGALETAICWMAINEKNGLPLHCWDGEKDEELAFHPENSNYKPPSICMTNSFAFGGCNVSLILGCNK